MSKFLTTGGFEWRDPKQYDMIKYTGNSSNSYVSEKKANLEYSKELGELYNNYSLAPDKMEIKKHVF